VTFSLIGKGQIKLCYGEKTTQIMAVLIIREL